MPLDKAAEMPHTRVTKRGPLEVWMAMNGYDADVPEWWLDAMDFDDDAFLASVQDLRRGGRGTWYSSKRSDDTDRIVFDESEPWEQRERARLDARRDMRDAE